MSGVLWVMGIVAVLTLGWWASLWWPWKRCPRCGGAGVLSNSFLGAHRDCLRCGGNKRVRRFGAPTERN